MALTLEELSNLQRFAPITRPNPQNQGEYFSFIEQGPPSISDISAATRSSNPYASLMNLTPQQRAAGSMGGFDPSIYKKLPGLLTQPAAGTVGGSGGGGDGGNYVVGGGGGGGSGNLGVGPGQGVSSDAQQTALSLIAFGNKYPGFLPGGIFAKALGLLGGLTADSQTAKMAEAQKAIEAIDKQNAAALQSSSSRTLDPYGGTKGVMSVSDKEGNIRSFDPYAGDSARDVDRAAALAASIADAREARDIENAQAAKNVSLAPVQESRTLELGKAMPLDDGSAPKITVSTPTAAQVAALQKDLQDAQNQRDAQAAANASFAASLATAAASPQDTSSFAESSGFTSGADSSGYGGGDLGGFLAKGGKVNIAPQMFNPPGPDDRYAALQNGEYVIKKKSTKKYGDDVLSQINAGRIPARRLKSLLE